VLNWASKTDNNDDKKEQHGDIVASLVTVEKRQTDLTPFVKCTNDTPFNIITITTTSTTTTTLAPSTTTTTLAPSTTTTTLAPSTTTTICESGSNNNKRKRSYCGNDQPLFYSNAKIVNPNETIQLPLPFYNGGRGAVENQISTYKLNVSIMQNGEFLESSTVQLGGVVLFVNTAIPQYISQSANSCMGCTDILKHVCSCLKTDSPISTRNIINAVSSFLSLRNVFQPLSWDEFESIGKKFGIYRKDFKTLESKAWVWMEEFYFARCIYRRFHNSYDLEIYKMRSMGILHFIDTSTAEKYMNTLECLKSKNSDACILMPCFSNPGFVCITRRKSPQEPNIIVHELFNHLE
jgi:hypothetical protein